MHGNAEGQGPKLEDSGLDPTQRLTQVLESLGTANSVFDTEFRLVLQNSLSAKHLGKALGEAYGQTVMEIFGQQSGGSVQERLRECLASSRTAVFLTRFDLPAGPAWFRSSYHPILDHTGKAQGVQVVSQDVTEQRVAERELQASEERFRHAFEGAAVGMVLTALDGSLLEANRAFAEMLGYEVEALRGLPFSGLTHPEDVELSRDQVQRLQRTGQSVRFAKRYLHRSGGIVWAEVASILLRSADGSPSHFVTHVQNVTERRAAGLALEDEKERLAVTLRSIADGVITTDTAGRVALMNHAAEQLTGWTNAEAAGRPLEEVFAVIDEGTGAAVLNPVEKVLLSQESVGELDRRTLLVNRRGQRWVIAASGAPIKDGAGLAIGVVLVFRDISEKERVLAGLQQAAKLESLGVLAGGIAHDFNNLLAGLFGFLSIARTHCPEGHPALEPLDSAFEAFGRAKALTEQLLTFSKGGHPVRTTCAVGPLAEEATRFALSGTNVRADFSLPPGLWPCELDRNQLAQAVDNLVINACQAMPQGGTLRVGAENLELADGERPGLAPGRYVRVSVEDQGAGIPPDVLPRIFDPFFSTKPQGSGLGLAAAYSILKKHQGLISASSASGQGARFDLYLPASPQLVLAGEAQTAAVAGNQGMGLRILVMDDEPMIQKVLKRVLSREGYQVAVASDGAEALALVTQAKADSQGFAAAILDLTVPRGLGGRATAEQLSALEPELPLIASSGYSADPVVSEPRRFGFSASLPKPYRTEELIAVLAQVIRPA